MNTENDLLSVLSFGSGFEEFIKKEIKEEVEDPDIPLTGNIQPKCIRENILTSQTPKKLCLHFSRLRTFL